MPEHEHTRDRLRLDEDRWPLDEAAAAITSAPTSGAGGQDPHIAGGLTTHGARLFRHARREAIFVTVVWAASLVWTVGYCYLYGYQHAPDSWAVRIGLVVPRTAADFQHWAGLPDWVLIGIVFPWLLCTVITIGFCLWGMTDDPLGAETEEGAGHGH